MPATIEIGENLDNELIVTKKNTPIIASEGTSQDPGSAFLPLASHIERGRHLSEFEEARDVLVKVEQKDGVCFAHFRFGLVLLPQELFDKLKPLEGKNACVLKLEGYHIREFS